MTNLDGFPQFVDLREISCEMAVPFKENNPKKNYGTEV